ncbi:hypothetical protein CBR_g39919 [Chara braunii]|uniref:biotin carboxylase n=1 Tax=Chara braunii TaxID=69332 RepID=A0A388K1J2_CHABU|nr:hypothetical protein CBR_g39919 [Chara braunii]|eukprot:GBG63914.1 hypothetical protein CBR_g39919 [Chara braunii]
MQIDALVDSESTHSYVSKKGLKKLHLGMKMQKLSEPVVSKLADNCEMRVEEYVEGIKAYFRLEGEKKVEKLLYSLTLLVEENLPFDIILAGDWGNTAYADVKMGEHECWLPSPEGGKKKMRLFHESGIEFSPSLCCMCAPALARHVGKENVVGLFLVAYVKPTTEEEQMEEVIMHQVENLLKEFADLGESTAGGVEREIKHQIEIEPGSRTPKGPTFWMKENVCDPPSVLHVARNEARLYYVYPRLQSLSAEQEFMDTKVKSRNGSNAIVHCPSGTYAASDSSKLSHKRNAKATLCLNGSDGSGFLCGGDGTINGHVVRQRLIRYGRKAWRHRNGLGAAVQCFNQEKILIANRGEIAVRVIRTAHELGIPCVAVHSTIDSESLHVQLADEAVCIGEAPSSESYLNIPNIVAAAISHGCTMVHPGYGFLSENATFVDICNDHGLNFIGPKPDSIRIMGDKATARETMKVAGVPIVPGSDGLVKDTAEAVRLANEIGFPIMIKATAGGGGRGMRLAMEPEAFVKLLQQAKSEAGAAFGNDGVYLEKYIQSPRHIEFQMAALVRENKERRELLKQAKLKAIAEEQAAKRKKLEEEMMRVEQEEEERRKAAEEEAAAAEEEEERLERRRREERGESSGTTEEDAKLEKKISEWVENLSLGEDEEAQLYVPHEEKEAFARALEMIDEPLERQETEDEKKLEWKLRMKREKKRRREEAARLAAKVEKVQGCRQEVQAQAEVPAKLDKILGYLEVLEKLREANFKINAKKCEWAKTQVRYLGHVLDGDGIKPEDSKIAAIRDWPTPRTLTELRSFLGLANYYRKFVRNFSTIAAPLRRSLKKEAIWQWDKDCTSALKKLKHALIEYPVLKVANPSLPFFVTTDASQYGIGAVSQQDDDNGYRPVEFMSARMPSEKVATSTYERELYALRQTLEHWKHYLLGRHFKVYSDHETLRWLKTQAKMTPKLTRWAAEIDQYDFELKPVKGKYNVVADALSRRSDVTYFNEYGRTKDQPI